MDILLKTYKDDPHNKELEIRIYIDPRQLRRSYRPGPININAVTEMLKNLIKTLSNTSKSKISISKTVEFIRDQVTVGKKPKKIRATIVYPSKDITYSSKKELMAIVEKSVYGNYKIALAEEKVIPDNTSLFELYTFIRIKLRISIIVKDINNFRYDITFVKSIEEDDIASSLKGSVNKMLSNLINSTNLLRHLPFEFCDHVEVEAEFINDDMAIENLTISSVIQAINYIYNIVNPKQKWTIEYQKFLKIVASYVIPKVNLPNIMLKNVYNSVKELSRLTYFEDVWPTITNWYLTDKADGKRCIVMIHDKIKIISDKLYTIEEDSKSNDDSAESIISSSKAVTIIDAELIYTGNIHIKPTNVILFTFDVIVFEGENLSDKPFEERLEYLHRATSLLNRGYKIAQEKIYIKLTNNYKNEIKSVLSKSRPYTIDGLIFTPAGPSKLDEIHNKANIHNKRNTTYQNMIVKKWKSSKHMSVDLLVRRPPDKVIGKFPALERLNHTLYYLFAGIKHDIFNRMRLIPVNGYRLMFGDTILNEKYHPIQFSPSINPLAFVYLHPNKKTASSLGLESDNKYPLDKTLGEFKLIQDKSGEYSWNLMRIRLDRMTEVKSGLDFGNNFTLVAEPTYNNFFDPLTLADLTISPDEYKIQGYFQYDDSDLHRNQRSFNSFVKSTLLEKFKGSEWVVDMAAGKGQDIFRHNRFKTENILFIDNDVRALIELLNRKNILLTRYKHPVKTFPMAMYVKNLDLNNRWSQNIIAIKKNIPIPENGVNLVVCNFAFHYLIKSEKYLDNIVKFINRLTTMGGHVIITTLDGQKVFNLLVKHNGKYNVYDKSGTILKYSIYAKYPKTKRFSQIGQEIDVLLPFSAGERYTETLVNVSYVTGRFKKYGFEVDTYGSFGDHLESFANNEEKKDNKINKYKTMTDDDKEYVSLYQYIILVKTTNVLVKR